MSPAWAAGNVCIEVIYMNDMALPFYVYVNIIKIQMKFYYHDYIVVNGSVLLIVHGHLSCFDGKH